MGTPKQIVVYRDAQALKRPLLKSSTDKPHTSVLDEKVTSSSIFTWSAATWDGKKIWATCRTVAAVEHINHRRCLHQARSSEAPGDKVRR